MIDALITTAVFLLIFISVEAVSRRYKTSLEITRKIAHILSGLLTFFSAFFLTKLEIIGISIFFVVLLLLTKYFNLIKGIHGVQRKTFGEIFFPLGNILCAVFFLPHDVSAFQFGVLTVAVSDALAALVGVRFGKHTVSICGHQKSLEGSSTFFVTNMLMLTYLYKGFDVKTIVIPAVLTASELLLVLGLDNLVLPSLAAYMFSVL